MSTTDIAPPAASTATRRIQSLDIFRGITFAVMIFVNALPERDGLPWWTHHAHAMEDRMTYVDMVFPFFLFIIGVAMPIAITSRLRKNPSQIALWTHILLRSVSLLVLGLILANAEYASRALMPIGESLWAVLALFSCCLYLNVYPKSARFPHYATILRGIGLIGVVIMLAIFRRETPAGPAWLDFGYPEILGLIGISYFASTLLYVPTRNIRWMQPVWFLLLVAFNVGSFLHLFPFTHHLSHYIWVFGNGSEPSIIFAGIVVSALLFPQAKQGATAQPKLGLTLVFGVAMLIAAFLLTPLGISKIRATPTWCLYSAGAAAIFLTGLYWLCDLKKKSGWAFLFQTAGSNGLLTYLLPDFWYYIAAIVGFTWLDAHFAHGAPEVIKTVLFTIVILLIAKGLTRLRLRLQL
jgi:heparan-alpha-glucosaminide N-acetyltransferase